MSDLIFSEVLQDAEREREIAAPIPKPEWIIQERYSFSDEWHDYPHCAPFFNRECAVQFAVGLNSSHVHVYRVAPRNISAVQKLLLDWKQDSEWHKKRAKDYANRCGGAPQWIAEAAADMLLECLKELEAALKEDEQQNHQAASQAATS